MDGGTEGQEVREEERYRQRKDNQGGKKMQKRIEWCEKEGKWRVGKKGRKDNEKRKKKKRGEEKI